MTQNLPPVHLTCAQRLHQRFLDFKPTPTNVLNLSTDSGALQSLLPHARTDKLSTIVPSSQPCIVANLTLATTPNAPQLLWQMGQALQPDGILLANVLGYESFRELRHAADMCSWSGSPTSPLPDLQAVADALQNLKFALPVIDRELITLTFPSWARMLAFKRQHGARNTHPERPQHLLTPRQLAQLQTTYQRLYTRPDGRLPLTLEVISLHALRPASWQPQPLPRGSGRIKILTTQP